MSGDLLHTKLYAPRIRPSLVPRPRLIAKLNAGPGQSEGFACKLTLISAPAGSGKTTLIASYVAGGEYPVAWLSLDKDDNRNGRFLTYLIAALQEVDHTIGSEAAQLMKTSHQMPSDQVLTSLINELDNVGREISLVLDDYHLIHSRAVHEEVAFLLEHCPGTFHLVIVSRSDPPLPLARLRARGQMVELRAADLRFTEAEAVRFLNNVMELHLDTESAAALTKRTEGWIAGLQMAALSMRDREDVSGFINGFSGTNRYILDYLLEEILANQPPEIQRFLLFTSILRRLTAPLCDAILTDDETTKKEVDGWAVGAALHFVTQSAATLEYLERGNLFLVPLDDERTWYRYHHLFADLLSVQLQKSVDAESIAKLHLRASEWHGQYGSLLEAIHHAAMAEDAERVERFIKQNYLELVSRGEMSRIRFWIGKLSRELVYNRPWLCIYEAYSYAWFGELDTAIRLLEEAEKHFRPEIAMPETLSIQGHLAYVKSRITAMHGDVRQAIELCLAAREYIPADNLALQLDTQITLGYEYFLNGDFANAGRQLNEMIQMGTTVGAVINTVAASCVMARLAVIEGQLHQAYNTYQTAARLIPDEGGQHLGARSLIEVGMADLLCEWNNLEAALAHVDEGLALISLWDKADDLAFAYITLARIHLAQANYREATEAVERAAYLVQTRGVFSEARHAVAYAQVKLWLAQGDLPAAGRWAASQAKRSHLDDLPAFTNELIHISQARILNAKNRFDEAIRLLSRLEENAQSGGRTGRLIEIRILKALAMQKTGDAEQAMNVLAQSLAPAEPAGYVRIFLDEGKPMQMLLTQWQARDNSTPLRDYAIHLLSQFEAEVSVTAVHEKNPPVNVPSASSGQALLEPLSPREVEVLQVMALGKTNKEIARQLIIAPGTVKAHTAGIYRKLDVANRTEAVARARELGILS